MPDSKSIKDDFLNPIAKRAHTVSFNTSTPSTLIDPIRVMHGNIFERIGVERPFCEVDAWYVDRNLKKEYDFSQPVVEDLVLYARWRYEQPMYIVSFCGDQTIDEFVKQGDTVKRPPDPVKRGYNFLGWYLTDVPDEAFYYIFDTPVVSNFALFPMWEELTKPIDGPIRPIKG